MAKNMRAKKHTFPVHNKTNIKEMKKKFDKFYLNFYEIKFIFPCRYILFMYAIIKKL